MATQQPTNALGLFRLKPGLTGQIVRARVEEFHKKALTVCKTLPDETKAELLGEYAEWISDPYAEHVREHRLFRDMVSYVIKAG